MTALCLAIVMRFVKPLPRITNVDFYVDIFGNPNCVLFFVIAAPSPPQTAGDVRVCVKPQEDHGHE